MNPKITNTLLWVAQILLAALFAFHGLALINPPEAMKAIFDALPFSRGFLSLIGVLELLGAAGLILPSLTRTQVWLTPLAALGLTAIMLGAIGTHLTRAEYGQGITNLVIVTLLGLVIWGRKPQSAARS